MDLFFLFAVTEIKLEEVIKAVIVFSYSLSCIFSVFIIGFK